MDKFLTGLDRRFAGDSEEPVYLSRSEVLRLLSLVELIQERLVIMLEACGTGDVVDGVDLVEGEGDGQT